MKRYFESIKIGPSALIRTDIPFGGRLSSNVRTKISGGNFSIRGGILRVILTISIASKII